MVRVVDTLAVMWAHAPMSNNDEHPQRKAAVTQWLDWAMAGYPSNDPTPGGDNDNMSIAHMSNRPHVTTMLRSTSDLTLYA